MAILIIVAVVASGVTLPGLESNPSFRSETGRLTVLLKDAPVDVDELWINITALEVHKTGDGDGEWIPIDISDAIELTNLLGKNRDYLEFDLLLYQDKEVLVLAEADVYEGSYNKIRMKVRDAQAYYWVDEDGEPLVLDPDTGYPAKPRRY